MAIEQIPESDTYDRFGGYFIRQTVVNSVAKAILEPGAEPEEIGKVDEYHYGVYHKEPFQTSVLEEVYDSYEEALEALKGFISDEQN